jgi:hypothetical protein
MADKEVTDQASWIQLLSPPRRQLEHVRQGGTDQFTVA